MDVDSFIHKYRLDWERLNGLVGKGGRGLARRSGPELDEAVGLHLRVSAHLAQARTHYRDPDLIRYLNGLVTRSRGAIYEAPSGRLRGLTSTLMVRFRLEVRATAWHIAVSALLFTAVLVAMHVWIVTSPEARAGLIPPAARDAIERFGGEAADFGIGPGAISTAILINNIQVAMLAFALGITAGIGTSVVLVFNGALIGTLSGGFAAAGKSAGFWSLILPHGLLELTAIFVAAGAGLRIGWALVVPGDARRTAAMTAAARGSLVVLGGTVPAFVAAGLIEGYVTGSPLSTPVELAIGAIAWIAYLGLLLAPQRRP